MERPTMDATARQDHERDRRPDLPVTVVATTVQATRSALLAAREFAAERNAHIVLLLPRVVSPALPLDGATVDPSVITRAYADLARDLDATVTIQLCFCRRAEEVFATALDKRAIVVVGGRHHWFWRGAPERMARRLERLGHRVVFVDTGLER